MPCAGCARRRAKIKAALGRGKRWISGHKQQEKQHGEISSSGIGAPIERSGNRKDVVTRA